VGWKGEEREVKKQEQARWKKRKMLQVKAEGQ
jgi:hypothetical protein